MSYRTLFLSFVFSFLLLGSVTAPAEEKKALSASSYKVISRAQDLLQKKEAKQAIQKIRSLLPKIKNNPYDLAVAYQTLGYAFYEAKDRKNARVAFIKAVESKQLPAEINQQLEFNILQMYAFDEDYQKAATYLEQWLAKKPTLNKDANILAATIYYNLKRYKKMIPFVQRAIKLSPSFDKSLYQLLAAAYIETKNYKKAADVYEIFIQREPNNQEHWQQLVSIYQLSKQYKKALSVGELAYKKGVMKSEKQILNLANNYLYNKIPLKAAELMQKEIANGKISRNKTNIELLANSWILAQEEEKAISVLNSYLANNNNSDMLFRLGQLYYEVSDWPNTIKTLNTFKETAKKHPSMSKALMLLGIAAYENKDLKLSENAFKQALRYQDSRNDAEVWLKQLRTVTSSVSISATP